MGTVFNFAIIHFKYTFTFVIGVYAFELITKSLVSAIAGHLHIPDFWVKLTMKPAEEEKVNRYKPYNSFTDYDYHHMTKAESDAYVKKSIKNNTSSSDLNERLKRFR